MIEIYGSLDDADDFFAETDLEGIWDSFDDAKKTIALKKATKQIDRLKFHGEKFDFTQTREFPRQFFDKFDIMYFDLTPDGDIVVPRDVIEATYLQAKFLLESIDDERINAIKQGITSQSIGATSESYNIELLPVDVKTGSEISRESMLLLKKFLIVGF